MNAQVEGDKSLTCENDLVDLLNDKFDLDKYQFELNESPGGS